MKALLLLLALITAHHAMADTQEERDDLALEQALEQATKEERKAYEECVTEDSDMNCANEELGDIYN